MENKEKKNLGLTLTIICNITSNYGESLGMHHLYKKFLKMVKFMLPEAEKV